jgi:secreted PhoX family phosphatase
VLIVTSTWWLISPLGDAARGEHTPSAPFITLTGPGTVTPIIDSGQTHDGFLFEGIPDGIGVMPGEDDDTVEVFVNHEQSTVPFQNTADFQDSSVSQLTIDTDTAELIEGSVAIGPEAGFLRFCSAFMAGPDEGFDRYTFFTGEETNDVVDVPPGAPYGPDPSVAPNRQGGYAVALDAESGDYDVLPGMGRMNHENTVVVPGGWSRVAALTTDDTFAPPTSQLYEYLASSPRQLTRDRGSLWAFRVTHDDDGRVRAGDPFNGANDYLDIQPGDDWRGEFIRVPKRIAEGTTDERPQEALEQWSNEHNVFQFIRLEDVAYDDDHHRVVYVADTGSTRIVHDESTGRMVRGPSGTVGEADNGRIFRFELNRHNPRKVDSFSVYADGDAPGTPEFVAFTSPDNIDTSESSLMVQEDTSNAAIWRQDFGTGAWEIVATVNDPVGESSGIVDASEWFGDGAWLLDVQAHGTFVDQEQQGAVLVKREAGQLMLMTIPGT